MRLVSTQDLYHLTVIAVLVATGAIPSAPLRERVARQLGWLASVSSRQKRRRSEIGIAAAFGRQRDSAPIVRASFQDFWREMLSWTTAPRRGAEVTGLEHLRAALAEGRGAILWESNGFGRRLQAKQVLHSLGFGLHQIHGRRNLGGLRASDHSDSWVRSALVRRFFDTRELRCVADLVYLPASDSLAFTRDLQERLRRNAVLCVSGDGRDSKRLVPLEFLGRTVMFSSGTVSLARLCGAPLLPLFCTPGGDATPRLTIEAPIRVDTSVGRDEGLLRALSEYVALLEGHIRRRPDLYRNWHELAEHPPEERELAA